MGVERRDLHEGHAIMVAGATVDERVANIQTSTEAFAPSVFAKLAIYATSILAGISLVYAKLKPSEQGEAPKPETQEQIVNPYVISSEDAAKLEAAQANKPEKNDKSESRTR